MNYVLLHLNNHSYPSLFPAFSTKSNIKKQMKRPDGALINPKRNETATTGSSWKKERSPRSV